MSKQDFEKARNDFATEQTMLHDRNGPTGEFGPNAEIDQFMIKLGADWAYSYAQKEIDELKAENEKAKKLLNEIGDMVYVNRRDFDRLRVQEFETFNVHTLDSISAEIQMFFFKLEGQK